MRIEFSGDHLAALIIIRDIHRIGNAPAVRAARHFDHRHARALHAHGIPMTGGQAAGKHLAPAAALREQRIILEKICGGGYLAAILRMQIQRIFAVDRRPVIELKRSAVQVGGKQRIVN